MGRRRPRFVGVPVAANAAGEEVARITEAPKALAAGMERQRRLAKSLSRKQKDPVTAVTPPPSWGVTTAT